MRGYYGIGIWHPKADVNVGSLLRSAASLGAAFVFTIGRRYTQEAPDTTRAWRHVPLWHFEAFADLRAALPFHCWLVGIELDERARPLQTFCHPERAVYLLGAEDQGLNEAMRAACNELVQLPGTHCLNVATAGAIVLYDRVVKRGLA